MKRPFSVNDLNKMIVDAKNSINSGKRTWNLPYRLGSIDFQYDDPDKGFVYLSSRFGRFDFITQEILYWSDEPIWAMNYYGHLRNQEDRNRVEEIAKQSMAHLYMQERFLGGIEEVIGNSSYNEKSEGTLLSFKGQGTVSYKNLQLFEFYYHGGLLIDERELKSKRRPTIKFDGGK